jgi:hypothetical protein
MTAGGPMLGKVKNKALLFHAGRIQHICWRLKIPAFCLFQSDQFEYNATKIRKIM